MALTEQVLYLSGEREYLNPLFLPVTEPFIMYITQS